MTEIPLKDFQARIEEHFSRLEDDRQEVVITRAGDEPMAVLPLAELRSLRETLHLLSNASNAGRLQSSIAELDAAQGQERSLTSA